MFFVQFSKSITFNFMWCFTDELLKICEKYDKNIKDYILGFYLMFDTI